MHYFNMLEHIIQLFSPTCSAIILVFSQKNFAVHWQRHNITYKDTLTTEW